MKLETMIKDYHDAIISLASKKLNRDLTEPEKNGIKNVKSFMMLEALEMEFVSDKSTSETLEKTIEFLARDKSNV